MYDKFKTRFLHSFYSYLQEKGNKPIHVAARAGQMAQVELLVVHGADPGALDRQGNTPSGLAR